MNKVTELIEVYRPFFQEAAGIKEKGGGKVYFFCAYQKGSVFSLIM